MLISWWSHFMRRWLFGDTVARWVVILAIAVVTFEILRAIARGVIVVVIR